MEERLENWKFAQFCPKTTICSGCGSTALIDIWKRWLKQESKGWPSPCGHRHEVPPIKVGKQGDRSMRRKTLKNHMWSTLSCLGTKIGFACGRCTSGRALHSHRMPERSRTQVSTFLLDMVLQIKGLISLGMFTMRLFWRFRQGVSVLKRSSR